MKKKKLEITFNYSLMTVYYLKKFEIKWLQMVKTNTHLKHFKNENNQSNYKCKKKGQKL